MTNRLNYTKSIMMDNIAGEIEMEVRRLVIKSNPEAFNEPDLEIIFPSDINLYPEIIIRSINGHNNISSKKWLKELLEVTYEEVRGKFLANKMLTKT